MASEPPRRNERAVLIEITHYGPPHLMQRKRSLWLEDGNAHRGERELAGAVIRSIHRVDNKAPPGRAVAEALETRLLGEQEPIGEAGSQLFEHDLICSYIKRLLRVTVAVDSDGDGRYRGQARKPTTNGTVDAH